MHRTQPVLGRGRKASSATTGKQGLRNTWAGGRKVKRMETRHQRGTERERVEKWTHSNKD